MANRIISIGEQQTNLLSNDNLIVYSDISMISKFNPAATSTTVCKNPQEEDYYNVVGTENYLYATADDGTYFLFHSNENYLNDKKRYINKLSLSKYRVEKNINVKAVQNSLHNIFTWLPGERILNPEFGSVLYRYLYAGITEYNTEQIVAEIQKSISEWEPRVKLEHIKNISNINDTENNTIHLEILYTIPSLTDEQYSYTYIYHKQTI